MADEARTTAEQPKSGTETAALEFARGAGRMMFYANHGQASISLFEIRLLLNFVQGVNPETNRLVIDSNLTLVLSPEMAAAIHRVLGSALENYKKQYGPLRQPHLVEGLGEMGTIVEVPNLPVQPKP